MSHTINRLILFALSGLLFSTPAFKGAFAQGVSITPNNSSGGTTVTIGTSGGSDLEFTFGNSSSGGGSGSGGGSSSSGGGSGTIASQTCDTQVWKTMSDRARLETEREMMQNQNLIFKADSVLNYTCFDSFAAHAAKNVGSLFTHTTYFTGSPIIPWSSEYGMDYALEMAVIKSMQGYIDSNFSHSYLGGRGQYLGLDYPVINSVPRGGGDYQCDVMSEVWRVAKCLNFIHTQDFATTDGYYPFIDLKGVNNPDIAGYSNPSISDTRKFPTECTGQPFAGSTWEQMYRSSRNETGFGANDKYYPYGDSIRKTFKAVRDLIKPGQCGTAIPTGVTVLLSAGEQGYPDGICTNPGCSYTKGGSCQ